MRFPICKSLISPSPRNLAASTLTSRLLFLLICIASLHAAPCLADTPVSGSVSGTWTASGSPYVVVGSITVDSGQTLIIDKSVAVNFGSNESMTVNGTLITQGLPSEGVVFTSPDSLPGSWAGIYAQSGSVVDMNNTAILWGGQGGAACLITTSGTADSIAIRNSFIRHSAGDGMRINASHLFLQNVIATDNAADGIQLNTYSEPPQLDNLLLDDNGGTALILDDNPGNLPGNLAGSGNGINGVYVTGQLGGGAASGRWTWQANPGFPVICDAVSVSSDTLDIEAGTVIKMYTTSSNLHLNTNAKLETGVLVDGQSAGAVWVTSLKDDTVGGDTNADGVASQPAAGDWTAIYAQSGAAADLHDTWLAYGGHSGLANLATTNGFATSIHWDRGGTLHSLDDGVRVTVQDVALSHLVADDNGADGLQLNTFSIPAVLDSIAAHDNLGRALVLDDNPGDLPGNLSGTGNGINGVYLTGQLGGGAASGRWTWQTNPGFPAVCDAVSVNSDTLDIEAGAVIKMYTTSSYLQLNSNAKLETGVLVDGQSAGPVWVTSLKDDTIAGDTNADGGASQPAAGDWTAIYAQSGAAADLQDTWLAYGGHSGLANLVTTNGFATSIQWDRGGTLHSLDDGVRVSVQDVALSHLVADDNGVDGLQVNTYSIPAVLDSIAAHDNLGRALVLDDNPGNLPGNLSGSGNGINGVYLTGQLGGGAASGRWTWQANPSFPVICDAVSVSSDTLDVEAGAVIKMYTTSSNLHLNSNAKLETGVLVDGQSAGPVWVTSLKDDTVAGDTNADGVASQPAAGDWTAIYAQSGAAADLHDTWLAYGGYSGLANLVTTNGFATSIHWDRGGTLHSLDDGVRVSVQDVALSHLVAEANGADGLELNTYSVPAVLDSIAAHDNLGRALALDDNPGNLPGNLGGSGNGINGTYLTGQLGGGAASRRWTWQANPGFPVICSAVSVSSDTLDIEAGAVIKMYAASSNLAIQNNGVLLSGISPSAKSGTVGGSVWITSLLDDQHGGDTNHDGSGSAPSPGDWSTVYAQSGAKVQLADTWFAYGGYSSSADFVTTSGQATDLSWNGGGAILSQNDGIRVNFNTATVTGVRFSGNLGDGVQITSSTGATFSGCDIEGNGSDGMRWSGGPVVLAQGNWWGDASGPQHPTLNPAGLGNPVSDNVDFQNWATSALTNIGPGDFLLTAPQDGVTLDLASAGSDSVQFTWNAAVDPDGDALTYELAVNKTPAFAPAGEVFHASGLTSTSQWVTGFTPNTTYYWCVSATDGLASRASTPTVASFTVAPDSTVTAVEQSSIAFTVGLPAPNPFTSHSQIAFTLPTSEHVSVKIYNIRGRLVNTILDGMQTAGRHFVIWNGRDRAGQTAASGVYFARVMTPQGDRTRRVVVVH